MSVGSTLVRGAEIRFQEAAEKLRPFCRLLLGDHRGPGPPSSSSCPTGAPQSPLSLQDAGIPAWSLRGPLLKPAARRLRGATTVVGIRCDRGSHSS